MSDSSNSQSAERVRAAAKRVIAELEKPIEPAKATLRRIAQMDILEAARADVARGLDNLTHDVRNQFAPIMKPWIESLETLEAGVKAVSRKSGEKS